MSTSLTELVREVAENLYPGKVVTGTTTGGASTTVIADTNSLANSDANINQYNGVQVRVDEKVGAGPDIGTYRRVDDEGYAGATGALTVIAFAAAVGTGTDFSIHRSLRPTELEKYANRILSQCHHRALHPLSSLTNYDYAKATVTVPDNWTQSGTATLVQSTDYVTWGRYSARLLAGAVGDYWYSANILVSPGDKWSIWAPLFVLLGNAELVVYDVSNAAEIEKGIKAGSGPGEIGYDFTIPSGCVLIRVHLQKSAVGSAMYWGPVCVTPLERVLLDLPSWMTTPSHLNGAVALPLGPSSSASGDVDAHIAYARRPRELPYKPEILPLHDNPRRVWVTPPSDGPVMIRAWRPFAELTEASGTSGASPTTEADHDTIIAGMLGIAHEAMSKLLLNSDARRSAQHLHWSRESFDSYAEQLRKQDYAVPETEVELPQVTYARLP